MKVFEFQECKFYIGKNAKENWELLDKAKAEDQNIVWFHLDSFPSPYVFMWSSISSLEELIKTEKTEKKEEISSINQFLNFGASLCKEHSKYKNMKDIKIMYTTVNKLTKTDKIGEVDIKGKYKTLKIVDIPASHVKQ
jgi:hypothetical protein